MKIKETKDGFITFELTPEECKNLLEIAKNSMKHTYPTPNQGYAAAALTDKGNIYSGASYTSDTHNLTMHGEAVTLALAAQQGETSIVAITGPNCHNCKQLIWESSIRSKIDTVIIIEEGKEIKQIPISTLMQYPWPDKFGNK